jgi:hypothetical protein
MKLNATLQRATLGFTGIVHVELRTDESNNFWCLPTLTLSNGAQIECEYIANINEDEFGDIISVVRCWMYNGGNDIYHDVIIPRDEYGLLPFSVDVPYSFTTQVPYDLEASVESLPGTEGGELWRAWTIAPDPNWLLDSKLKLWYSCPASQVVIVNAAIGDTTGAEYTWAAAAGAILNLGALSATILATPSDAPGGAWGAVGSASFVRTGLAPVNFGTHDYSINGFTVISLAGDTVTAYATASSQYAYANAVVYAGSFSTECTGTVKYVDGRLLHDAGFDPKLNLPENVRVHNGTTWGSGSIGTELDHDGGAALNYSGYWELTTLENFSGTIVGDYLVTTQNPLDIRAVCRDCTVATVDGDLRREHGPLTVKDVASLGQPDYVGAANESYSDCRVLLEHDDAALTITGALSVAVNASSRKVVDWAYGDTFRTSGVTPSNVGGKPAFHVDSAGAYIECDYSAVKEADAWAAHWLLVRYADINLVSGPAADFTVEIAEREYACSVAKPRVDLLAFTGAAITPATQSLLPTFLPERTKKTGGLDDGDPDPPVVTDIPKDWGVYLPGVIRFSGLTVGETYILDNITLQRLTDPVTLILPEPNWTGWQPDSTRSPEVGSDPPAFDDCGIGGTTAIPCHVWAQQIGWVIVDGAKLEIVGSLFRLNGLETQTWDVRYPMFDETGRPQYWAFPHAVSPFLTITQGGTRPSGYGWQTGEDVPLDYLVPGKHVGACSIDAKLRIVQYDLPANYPSVPINFSKDYGGLALVCVANPDRGAVARNLNLSTGCTGNYSATSDATGAYLTWGSTSATKTLSQWNGAYTRHEFTASVTDGAGGTTTGEVRNRAITFALVRSSAIMGLLYDQATGYLHYHVDGALEYK